MGRRWENRRQRVVLLIILWAALAVPFTPRPASAQWTQGRAGKVWIKSGLFFQKTNERFGIDGDREPWLGDGESDARGVFTDIIVGLGRRVDLWIQIPFFDLRFNRPQVDDLQTTGFGDIRTWVRWNPFALNKGATPISFRAGAKLPVGSSPLDAEVIPVGEGQWDVEFLGEIGHSFWPAPAYAELWLGYRARFENADNFKDPGGEFIYLAEAGVMPGQRSLFKVTFDGFEGRNWIVEGVRTGTKRRIATLQFAGAYRTGPVWPELGIRFPLWGQEFPAGNQFYIAISSNLN